MLSSSGNVYLSLHCFAEESLVNGFNQDEKGVLHTAELLSPSHPPTLLHTLHSCRTNVHL